ncbi:MAG TPA: glycosyltransferase [Burkholderiales bacterium]|nr:glycosyltransferase [Burkholderiales bacterium]
MNASAPLVSIVVTTYNRLNLLRETIDSILGQTFGDFELIVVDNLSEDGTTEYLSGVGDPRLQHIRHPNHGVIAVNRNLGVERARGRYVAFCDDDDLWLPDKLRLQVELMEQRREVALCYTNAESFLVDQIVSERMIRRRVRGNYFFQLLRGNYIPNSSVLIRREVFTELGLLTTDPTLREDYHMWLRIARRHPLAGLDASLIRYRVHSNNVAGNRAAETLRAIRTVKDVAALLNLSQFAVQPNLVFQFLKYLFYRFGRC